jgi:hypothetical protein
MGEQVIPSAVGHQVIFKFLTDENLRPAEILRRLRAQFRDETLSRIQVYEWSKSFKEGRT